MKKPILQSPKEVKTSNEFFNLKKRQFISKKGNKSYLFFWTKGLKLRRKEIFPEENYIFTHLFEKNKVLMLSRSWKDQPKFGNLKGYMLFKIKSSGALREIGRMISAVTYTLKI